MKRFFCFLLLLACLSFAALAVPNVFDGQIGPREYNETVTLVQSAKNDSLSNLQFAYLSWAVSPEDHSVYLAVQYHCKDHTTEDGQTGVAVFINDKQIGTIYPSDDPVCVVDDDRYKLVGWLDDGASRSPYDSFCEMQIGLKLWPEGEIKAGIQILDFSGNYSVYYDQTVYSPYTTTTMKPDAPTTTSAKTTAVKTTAEKSTTVRSAADKTTAADASVTTAAATHHASPAITASPKPETTAVKTTAASAAPQSTLRAETKAEPSAKKAVEKTTKSSTAKRKKATETAGTEASAAEPTTAETTTEVVAAAVLSATATTEPAVSESVSVAVSSAQMYSEMNKVKIVGTVLVAVILTAAILSAVFLGMRRKDEPAAPHPPQEEHDDFG